MRTRIPVHVRDAEIRESGPYKPCHAHRRDFYCMRPDGHGSIHLHQFPGTDGHSRLDFVTWTAGPAGALFVLDVDELTTQLIHAYIETAMLH